MSNVVKLEDHVARRVQELVGEIDERTQVFTEQDLRHLAPLDAYGMVLAAINRRFFNLCAGGELEDDLLACMAKHLNRDRGPLDHILRLTAVPSV
jgi:hypothetical protein